ncbi:MAG: response regulator [Candidatus Omnitrophica bacterium]|nr:response regulator [Candidatus Omnitrophota bacterium]
MNFVQLALLGSLTRKVIHEANNHLTGIYGYLTLAQNSPYLPEKIQTFLERSMSCCESSRNLNKSFADFFYTGKEESFTDSLVVEEVIHFSQKILGPHFSIQAEGDRSSEIAAPRTTVKLLLLFALLSVEYTIRQGGEIHITQKVGYHNDHSSIIIFNIYVRNQSVRRENRDNRPAEKILNQFVRRMSYLMAEELALQCGGKLNWRSSPAAISECQITLPLLSQSERKKSIPRKPPAAALKFKKSYRIFLLEDQSVIADFIENILHHEGHLVIVYNNGSEAASALSSRDISSIDLFLLDICVPGKNGIEVGAYIRQKDPESRLLFYSALRSEKHVLEYFSLDQKTQFLQKPFRKDELFQLVESLMTTKE